MNSNDEEIAKEIFLDHEGSGFFMSRTGVDDTYRKLEVPREKEVEWAKEEIERLLNKFVEERVKVSIVYSELIAFIEIARAPDSLRALFRSLRNKITELDVITLLVLAEETLRLMEASKCCEALSQRGLLEEEYVLVGDLLKCARTKEVHLSPDWHMDDLSPEAYVEERIGRALQTLESYVFPWDEKDGLIEWFRKLIPWPRGS